MPLNINFQQILLHLFNFVLLFAILYFLLYKPVRDFMAKRSASIEMLNDDAAAKLKEAEELKEEYAEKLENISSELEHRRNEAEHEAAEIKAKKIKEAEAEADRIVADARRRAEAEREKILKDTNSEIVELANALAEQVVTKNASEAFDLFLKSAERGGGDA